MAKAQKKTKPADAIRIEKNIYSRYSGESFQVKMSHGAHKINKTFDDLDQARAFRDGVNYKSATDVISQSVYKTVIDRKNAAGFTFAAALDRYAREYSEKKPSGDSEKSRIRRITKIAEELNIANKALLLVDKADIIAILDIVRKGKPRKGGGAIYPTTNDNLRRYIAILRHMFNIARHNKKWNIPVENPIQRYDFDIPESNPQRERRLNEGEWDRLKAAFAANDAGDVYILALYIVETGVRRREALENVWLNVKLNDRSVFLPADITKGRAARVVSLSIRAVEALKSLPRGIGTTKIFPESLTVYRARTQWQRACKSAGIENLQLRDLRHEAVSRMAESGKLSSLEVQKQAGHKDPRMTARYFQVNTRLFGEKLD